MGGSVFPFRETNFLLTYDIFCIVKRHQVKSCVIHKREHMFKSQHNEKELTFARELSFFYPFKINYL